MGDKDLDDSAAIERNIERALTDVTIHANVAAMREHFVRYEQDDAAVRLVERAATEGQRHRD